MFRQIVYAKERREKIVIHQLDDYWSAEWVWPAKSGIKDYHDNMDGVGFEW